MPCRNHPLVEEPLARCARCGDSFCADCIVDIAGAVYCAPCKRETVRNLQSGVSDVDLDLATIGRRAVALMVDNLLLSLPLIIGVIVLLVGNTLTAQQLSEEAAGGIFAVQILVSVGFLFLGIVYEGVMLSRRGQTVGKKMLGIKVVTPEGNDLTTKQAWMRSVVRNAFGLLSCLGFIDYLVAFGRERTCIHDQVAQTRVVRWNP